MGKVNEQQVGGKHYKKLVIEIWDFIVKNRIPYLEGNVVKYVVRWRDKAGKEDLLKARHYIDKLIEVATEEELQQHLNQQTAKMQAAACQGLVPQANAYPNHAYDVCGADASHRLGELVGRGSISDGEGYEINPSNRGG